LFQQGEAYFPSRDQKQTRFIMDSVIRQER
jgi:hypothetical protein